MTKQSYDVDENSTNRRPPRDTSCKSFVCALLIFLVICLIILLATINWTSGKKEPNTESSKGGDQYEVLGRKGVNYTQTHEKIVELTESTLTNEKLEESTTVPSTQKSEKIANISVPVLPNRTSIADFIDATTATEKENVTKTVLPTRSTILKGSSVSDSVDKKGSTVPVTTTEKENVTKVVASPSSNILNESTDFNLSKEKSSTVPPTTIELDNSTKSKITTILNGSTVSDSNERGSTVSTATTENENVTKAQLEKSTTVPTIQESEKITNISVPVNRTLIPDLDTTSPTVPEKANVTNAQVLESLTNSSTKSAEVSTSTVQVTLSETSTKSLIIPLTTSIRSITVEEIEDELNNTKRKVLPDDTKVKRMKRLCDSAMCNEKASHMICKMKNSATACEDFYEFACGGTYQSLEELTDVRDAEWLLTQLDSVDQSSAKYLKDFKKFYESCCQYEDDFNYNERMRRVKELVANVGEFQAGPQISRDEFTDIISKLILRQSMPLFDVGLDVDKQSGNLVFQLTLPEKSTLRTGLKDWSGLSHHKEKCLKKQHSNLYGTHLNLTKIYESYVSCYNNYYVYLRSVENVILEFDFFLNLTTEERNKQSQDIGINIDTEILQKIAKLSTQEVLNNLTSKNYSIRRISDLQIYYPVLNWKRLFEILTGREVQTGTLVQIYFENYFDQMLKSLSREKLKNALLAIYAYDLFINTVVPKKQSNRKLFCFDLSRKLLPDVWASLIQSMFSIGEQNGQNRRVRNLFEKLKGNFCKLLNDDDWMDDDSKILFLSKCGGLDLLLFSPPSNDALKRKYENVNITGNYQTDLIQLLVHLKKSIYGIEGRPISNTTIFSYFLDPLSTKSFTLYVRKFIAVPLGLMRKAPKGLPNYIGNIIIGFDLAQQMARHFDPIGIKYNFYLTSTSITSYEEFKSSYDDVMKGSFSERMLQNKNVTFQLNELGARNDMIVDNAAIRLIVDTVNLYENEDDDILLPWINSMYSREQLFHLTIAQVFCKKTTILDFMLQVFESGHLPPELKVDNIMSNSQNFSESFNCPVGLGMTKPENMLDQFPHLTNYDLE